MLRFLRIRHLAVIEAVDVEFEAGFNVLTGETGAGKSILVEAVALLLGGRSSADLVRTGEPQASIEAIFETADGRELIVRRDMPLMPPTLKPSELATPVDIIFVAAGSDARLLDASRECARGVVIAAMGRGNVPPDMVPAIERWIADAKPVVLTSRTQGGRVGQTYGYFGGGRTLEQIGAIFGGSRRAQQARIDLMLALGAGMDLDEIRSMFRDN